MLPRSAQPRQIGNLPRARHTQRMDTADINRRLESLIRLGQIAVVDHATARCRVKTGHLVTDWLPWLTARAGQTRTWCPPTVGEQCLLLSPSGETAAGIVLVGLYSTASNSPSNDQDEHQTIYPDGASVRYNHATGAMMINGIKTLTINASEHITLIAPEITLDAPQTTSTGKHTVKGLLSYLSGLLGRNGGSGASATIEGSLVQTSGELSSNGIVLDSHTHPGDSGGTTGAPQ